MIFNRSVQKEEFAVFESIFGDFFFKYPNGDELYSIVALYLAEGVYGEMKIADGESYELNYFGKEELPELESRAEKIIEWLISQKII